MSAFKEVEKMKILIVMHGAGSGGVEKSLRTLCKYINKDKFQVTVALPSEGPMKAYLDNLGIKTCITPIDSWTPIQFHFGERHYYKFLSGLKERVHSIVDIIKQNEIDIVHSSTLSVADGAFAAMLAGRPHLWHIHGKSVGTLNTYGCYLPVEILYHLVKDLSGQLIAVSHDVSRFLELYIPGSNVPVIYNGLDIKEFDDFARLPSMFRDEFGLKNKKVVALVGRISGVKGIEDYIDSAEQVLRIRKDAVFLIVGTDEDTKLAEAMKKKVREMKLSEGIIFTGMRNDVPALLRQADIFVCSSKAEGFSYSIVEAMAAAKPVVTTRCGGPEEIVIHGESGYHVDIGRPGQIADAVQSLLGSDQLLKDMGNRSRQVLEQRFSAENYAMNFEAVYLRLADDKRDVRSPWHEVILDMASTVGHLGTRTSNLENEVRDLRNFEKSLKDNFVYRSIKNIVNSFKK